MGYPPYPIGQHPEKDCCDYFDDFVICMHVLEYNYH